MAKRTTGVVRWYDGSRGYGYIDSEDGKDVLVHYSAINSRGVPYLTVGEQVEFFLEDTFRGPQATDVTSLN